MKTLGSYTQKNFINLLFMISLGLDVLHERSEAFLSDYNVFSALCSYEGRKESI
jgi:hypothetical protein